MSQSKIHNIFDKNKISISVCILAKNEEKNIKTLIESVYGFASEIIILDTGSTDKTVEIAQSYDSKIYYHPWNDDFAEARNICLSKASKPWILFLDADFVFLQESIKELIFSIELGFDLYYINCLETSGISHLLPFLFRNNLDIKFSGKIHEKIVFDTKIKTSFSNIYVLHTGFSDEKIIKEKIIRNTKIITKIKDSNENIDILEKIKLDIYEFYSISTENKLNYDILEKRINEIDRQISFLPKEKINIKRQLLESFYFFCINIIKNNVEIAKIEYLKQIILKALNLFPDSLNILYEYAEIEFYQDFYKSIKILNFILYLIDIKHETLNYYATNIKFKNRDFIIAQIVKKYYILGDYDSCKYYISKIDKLSQEIEKIVKVLNIEEKEFFNDFIDSETPLFYFRKAREYFYLNIDKKLIFETYNKSITLSKDTNDLYIELLCYADLILNFSFFYEKKDLDEIINTLKKNPLRTTFIFFSLAKYYKNNNNNDEALNFLEKALHLEIESLDFTDNLFFNIYQKDSNTKNYEYLKITEEICFLLE